CLDDSRVAGHPRRGRGGQRDVATSRQGGRGKTRRSSSRRRSRYTTAWPVGSVQGTVRPLTNGCPRLGLCDFSVAQRALTARRRRLPGQRTHSTAQLLKGTSNEDFPIVCDVQHSLACLGKL